jgi:hypothetical protein
MTVLEHERYFLLNIVNQRPSNKILWQTVPFFRSGILYRSFAQANCTVLSLRHTVPFFDSGKAQQEATYSRTQRALMVVELQQDTLA